MSNSMKPYELFSLHNEAKDVIKQIETDLSNVVFALYANNAYAPYDISSKLGYQWFFYQDFIIYDKIISVDSLKNNGYYSVYFGREEGLKQIDGLVIARNQRRIECFEANLRIDDPEIIKAYEALQ